ncbi:MAG: hypothetical protein H6695_16735 [Deferribacteres bacterium]|nr:hypothetical protein [candidate division KSB1 bacterium]MCB9511832.1 hypothetical protein [Deferribacteres bacterium]
MPKQSGLFLSVLTRVAAIVLLSVLCFAEKFARHHQNHIQKEGHATKRAAMLANQRKDAILVA